MTRLHAFARTHHGLIDVTTADRLGLSLAAWYRALDGGPLELVHPGVARIAGAPVTREQLILAAVWACGPGSMSSHRSSALVWGVRRPMDDPVDVIVPARSRSARIEGVVVHHPRDLVDLRPVVRGGIPTTSPTRMLLDLGAVDRAGVVSALTEILRTRVVSHRSIAAFLTEHRGKGRHGVRALERALDAVTIDGRMTDSPLERRMHALLAAFRLPPCEFHAQCAGYEVDFRVSGTHIVIECDGWGVHGADPEQFDFDRRRGADLAAAGFVQIHVTWAQVTREPAQVARRIEAVIRQWAPDVLALHRAAEKRSGRASSR
ncbi:MAG: DUF559 domain-containing protein [Acidimicrobiales bacterium]|nr:DUF559 domain-containing protein [Acidimicrobiales bacterium]MCB9392653.1 DUF559 domain-containing protein [Acidimicrobiaceae bacterium]